MVRRGVQTPTLWVVCRLKLPISDYRTDTKRVLDQCIRILQAMADVAADGGHLGTSINIMNLTQMVVQGRWITSSSLSTLPGVTDHHADAFARLQPPIVCLPQLVESMATKRRETQELLRRLLGNEPAQRCASVLDHLPRIEVAFTVVGQEDSSVFKPDEEYTLKASAIALADVMPQFDRAPYRSRSRA